MRNTSPRKHTGLFVVIAVALAALAVAGLRSTGAARPIAVKEGHALGLAQPIPGQPLNVLFVFAPNAGDTSTLARFYQNGSGRVSLFELAPAGAQQAMLSKKLFPSYVPEKNRSGLVDRATRISGVPVNHLVKVKEHVWPVFTKAKGIVSYPLLELSSVYPGTPGQPVPKAPSATPGPLAPALETDPGFTAAEVTSLLGSIESARQRGELDIVAFDGHDTVAAIEKRTPVARGVTLQALANGFGVHVPVQKPPPEKFSQNKLVVYDSNGLRGKLPPAIPAAVISRGNPSLPRVALTIDDGWDADMRILDLLRAWRIRFTAFPIGEYLATPQGRELATRVYDMGGEVCSHTWSHKTMRKVPEPFFVSEIWRSVEETAGLTHEVYPYIRFYGGDYDVQTVNWSSREGFWMVNWTVDTLDTKKGLTTDQRVANVLANLKPGAIILCHFGGFQTYDLLAKLIPQIQARGYEVTTLSRVLEGTPFRLNR